MFDKKRCVENIYALAKEKGLKIGDIEEKAGVSKGYLSRINKEDSTSIPTIDLLASIANQLGVGIDYLVNFPRDVLTPNEQFVFQFIDRLCQQTVAGKMDWVVESAAILTADSDEPVDNPLVRTMPEYSEEFNRQYETHVYTSMIYSNSVQVANNCYHTELPDGYSEVYLNAVNYLEPAKPEDRFHSHVWSEQIIEVYIVRNGVRPICSTFFLRDELKKAVNDLYTAVSSAPSHIGLEKSTKDIMKSFLDSFKDLNSPEELPF